MKLLITGFMGSGKSTLLKEWAPDFPGDAIDLDEEIAKRIGIEPQLLGGWIEENGFEDFRQRETATLKDLLNGEGNLLISLGGGAFHSSNRALYSDKDDIFSLWIKVCPTILWDRVKDEGNRPLVKNGLASFEALHSERLSDYNKADFSLNGEAYFPSFTHWVKTEPRLLKLLDG